MESVSKFKSHIASEGRKISKAKTGDTMLGPFKELPGHWENGNDLNGRGWNMIALPFVKKGQRLNYRILVNQYNETLKFTTVDTGVPNRGIKIPPGQNKDQLIVTLDYTQEVTQIAADDFPESGRLPPKPNAGIHHEPGLFLHMRNFAANGLNIARLGTIPHGNSLLALGRFSNAKVHAGGPNIPDVDALPIGGPSKNIEHPYLAPYKHYKDNPFRGIYDVTNPSDLLRKATPSGVKRTTTLHFSTNAISAGIVNIPFIEKHADASDMEFTMWILETDSDVFIQYMQVVMLDFFERSDNLPGKIKWPHVSFNTIKRTKVMK